MLVYFQTANSSTPKNAPFCWGMGLRLPLPHDCYAEVNQLSIAFITYLPNRLWNSSNDFILDASRGKS